MVAQSWQLFSCMVAQSWQLLSCMVAQSWQLLSCMVAQTHKGRDAKKVMEQAREGSLNHK